MVGSVLAVVGMHRSGTSLVAQVAMSVRFVHG